MRALQAATLGVCALLFLGVVVAGWPDLVFALALETSPLAWLQTSLLVACATAAALCASGEQGASARGWTVVALALLAAALDDRFMGHERVQALLAQAWGGGPAAVRWSQTLTLVYVPIGAGCVAWLHRHMQGEAWRWCAAALAVGTVALGLDAAFTAAGPAVLEETLETVAESLMLTGLLTQAHMRANRPR